MSRHLYLIRRNDQTDYDEVTGHVISATSPARARELAAHNCRCEGDELWRDPARSTVRVLASDVAEPEGVILTADHDG